MSAGRGENASFQSYQRRAAACILKIYPKAGMPACGKRRVSCLYRELFFGCPFCPCRNFMENTPFPRGQKICRTYFLHPPEGHENSAAKSRQKRKRGRRRPWRTREKRNPRCRRQRGFPVFAVRTHVHARAPPVSYYLTRTFSLPTMYMPLASPLVASVGITSLRRSTPSTV